MRRFLWSKIVLAGLCLVPEAAAACGDKFIVLGRGVRFQTVHAAANPASILLYMNPDSRLPAADRAYQLQATLRLAGHKPAAVETSREVTAALGSHSYDLVLGDLADAATLNEALAGAAFPNPCSCRCSTSLRPRRSKRPRRTTAASCRARARDAARAC